MNLSGQQLLDAVVTAIDLDYELHPFDDYFVVSVDSPPLRNKVDHDSLREALRRLEDGENLIVICDEKKIDRKKVFVVVVLDAKYMNGWLQDIKNRDKENPEIYDLFEATLIDPNCENAFELVEDGEQIYLTGSLLHGKFFSVFNSVNTQRFKRILLALLKLSAGKVKTKSFSYNFSELVDTYKNPDKANLELNTLNLRKDIGQQTTEIFKLISHHMISQNGERIDFCRALGRSQYLQIPSTDQEELMKIVYRLRRKKSSLTA